MRRAASLLVLLTFALASTACQTWRAVEVGALPGAGASAGERVRVTVTSGERLELDAAGLEGGTELVGTTDGDRELRIPLDQLRLVETRGFSGGRTALLAIGVGAVALVVVGVLTLGRCSVPGACH